MSLTNVALFVLLVMATSVVDFYNAEYCSCAQYFTVENNTLIRSFQTLNETTKTLNCTYLDCSRKYPNTNNLVLNDFPYFTSFSPDVFQNFSNLEYMDFTGGELQSLNKNVFNTLGRLKQLTLSNNKIDSLVDENLNSFFTHLNNLEYLGLDSNSISAVDLGRPFEGLGKLQNMDFNENNVDAFFFSALNELQTLTSLDISYNNIKHTVLNNFTGLDNLIYVSLSGNHLRELLFLSENISYPNLQWIDISSNSIQEIRNFSLKGTLSALQGITFNRNRISTIERDAFHFLPSSLYNIDLSANVLGSIPGALEKMFTTCTTLKKSCTALLNANPITSLTVPDFIFNYFDMMQNNSILANKTLGTTFDFENCCAIDVIRYFNYIYELDLGVTTCRYINLATNNTNAYNEPRIISNNVSQKDFNNMCSNLTKQCSQLKYHYFDTVNGVCIDKRIQCQDEFGDLAYFNTTDMTCSNLEKECIKESYQTFNETTLECSIIYDQAVAYCTSLNEVWNNYTYSCDPIFTKSYTSIAIGVGTSLGGLMALVCLVVGFWYRRYYKNRIEQKELDLLDGLTPMQFVLKVGGNNKIEILSDYQYLNKTSNRLDNMSNDSRSEEELDISEMASVTQLNYYNTGNTRVSNDNNELCENFNYYNMPPIIINANSSTDVNFINMIDNDFILLGQSLIDKLVGQNGNIVNPNNFRINNCSNYVFDNEKLTERNSSRVSTSGTSTAYDRCYSFTLDRALISPVKLI
eukprot:Pgem_evm1s19993